MKDGGAVDHEDVIIGKDDITTLGEGEEGSTADDKPGTKNGSARARGW